MKKTFISVCKNIIMQNNKTVREGLSRPLLPPIRFQSGKSGKRVTCHHALLKDKRGEVVGAIYYQPTPIIKAGAKVVIEYYGDIEVIE